MKRLIMVLAWWFMATSWESGGCDSYRVRGTYGPFPDEATCEEVKESQFKHYPTSKCWEVT